MALTGSQKAYLQARSGIARSGAIRSNYVFPLYGVVTVNGFDLTKYVQYGTLKITMAINEEPDTCSFEVMLTDALVQDNVVVGADVLIGLGGATENVLFGGRILTAQTTRGAGHVPSTRSVMCADYLQVLDSEYLVTYDWPPQSATVTILDLIARFTQKDASAVAISTAGVQANLPSHASVGVLTERVSTVLRKLVTMFTGGGGFYVDPLKVLHVWTGASEPGVQDPASLTLANPALKAFAETVDEAQVRDAAIVEGVRTTAPVGMPGADATDTTGRNLQSMPVMDARIINPDPASGIPHEVRIGTQRMTFLHAEGVWSAPAGTPQATIATVAIAYNPDPSLDSNRVQIWIESAAMLTGRVVPWVRIDEQYLKVLTYLADPPTPWIRVPRTGYGAMTGEIHANAVVTVIDSLGQGFVTTRYDAPGSLEQLRAQPIDAEVVMVVRSATLPAIHEQIVQDGRYTRQGAINRGTREITDFRRPLISIQFETDDLNAKPGRLQVYNLPEPPIGSMAGQYMILTAELTWPVWGQPPRRTCYATDVHPADVTDAWLVDKR